MMLTDNSQFTDDISVLVNDDGSWPDMPAIDADSCPFAKSSGESSPTATLVDEPYHYTLLPDDEMLLSIKWLLTPPTPEDQTPISEHPYQRLGKSPFADAYDHGSCLDIPMPSPVQPKWIHRRLWAREGNERGGERFLSDVIPRSWSKADGCASSSLPGCSEKQHPDRVKMVQLSQQQSRLARSPSVSPSTATTMSSYTVTQCQLTPKKSILSSRTSVSRKRSKHGRARSGSTPSVKFADAPTYYYDNEYKYACDEEDEDEESIPPTPSSTTPCISHFSSPPKCAPGQTSSSKVRQALVRFIPSIARRPPERPSISGPFPLWKEKDADGGSIRSVRSAPASRDRARTFWGRMMACNTQ